MSFKVVHYINQFFAQIGGEEKADYKPEKRDGHVGPGQALNGAFKGEAEVVGTVICGDSYFNENLEVATKEVIDMIKSFSPDGVVCGPAFNAGRYGMASGTVADAVAKQLKLPVVGGMYEENPGVDQFRKSVVIAKTADSARGMGKAIPTMASLILKLMKGEKLGTAKEEGYFEHGFRINVFHDEVGAERAVKMLVKKMKGEAFETEYPMPAFDRVDIAAPIKDIKHAKIAVVTSGGIVPKHNPDHIESSSASKFGTYHLKSDEMTLTEAGYETAHGGYDPTYANKFPNRVLPVDVLRDMEHEHVFEKLHETWYTTVGNGTSIANAKKYGEAIGHQLKEAGVDGVILTST